MLRERRRLVPFVATRGCGAGGRRGCDGDDVAEPGAGGGRQEARRHAQRDAPQAQADATDGRRARHLHVGGRNAASPARSRTYRVRLPLPKWCRHRRGTKSTLPSEIFTSEVQSELPTKILT